MRDVAGVSNQISEGGVYLKLCWENRTMVVQGTEKCITVTNGRLRYGEMYNCN